MPRGRMLNKKISRSAKVAMLSPRAALLFSWCIPQLDSEGRIYADAVSLKGAIVPYLEYMTIGVITECTKAICEVGLAIDYGNGKYMQFLGFSSNQRIDKLKEAPSEIPPPTPDELQLNSSLTPDPSKGKLSKEKLIAKAQPSKALQATFDKVYNKGKGLNIYGLMSKLKKQIGQPKEWQFPEEVLMRVCEAYERDKTNIRHPWPWFKKVLHDETALWHANEQIQRNRKRDDFAPAIKDILRMK